MKIDTRWLTVLLTLGLAAFVACSQQAVATRIEVVPAPQFASDNPQSIYAADPNDSWNRIFRALFTRTVKARLSSDFPEAAPFVHFRVQMGSFDLRLSKRTLSQTEIGDRAIDPLYPTFLTNEGALQVFSEPRFSELTDALGEAIHEQRSRSVIERALMQTDIWAAYDIIHSTRRRNKESKNFGNQKSMLLSLLTQFLRKLALTTDQIKSLDNNYLTAVTRKGLPNIFSPESGWLEIEFLDRRSHDVTADFRRATRVFVKPRSTPSNTGAFVEKLKHNQHLDEVEAVGLVIQNLLIDSSGRVVPSMLFSDAQFRFFTNDAKTGEIHTNVIQYELSRRLLLTDPATGGFSVINEKDPAYLSEAGNDYTFAGSIDEAGAPIMVPLRTRCSQCHGQSLTVLLTYSIHYLPPVPTVRILKSSDSERALTVARKKEEREDYKSLLLLR